MHRGPSLGAWRCGGAQEREAVRPLRTGLCGSWPLGLAVRILGLAVRVLGFSVVLDSWASCGPGVLGFSVVLGLCEPVLLLGLCEPGSPGVLGSL